MEGPFDNLTVWILSKLRRITQPCVVIHQKLGYLRVLSLHDSWLDSPFSSCPSYLSSKHWLYESASTQLRTQPCFTRHVNDCQVVTPIRWSLILSKGSKVSAENDEESNTSFFQLLRRTIFKSGLHLEIQVRQYHNLKVYCFNSRVSTGIIHRVDPKPKIKQSICSWVLPVCMQQIQAGILKLND